MVPLPLTEDGLKFALTPGGRPVAEMETEPVKPNSDATVRVAVGFEPGVMVTAAGGAAVMVRATGAAGTVAFAAAVKVNVLTPEPLAIDGGLKAAVTPAGKPLTLNETVP